MSRPGIHRASDARTLIVGCSRSPRAHPSMIEQLKLWLFCKLIPLHYGYTDVDSEAGLMYFQCIRCGEPVGHRDTFYDIERMKEDSEFTP